MFDAIYGSRSAAGDPYVLLYMLKLRKQSSKLKLYCSHQNVFAMFFMSTEPNAWKHCIII